jgi:hypothetical protein
MGRKTALIAIAVVAAFAQIPAPATGAGVGTREPPPEFSAGSSPPEVVVDRPASVKEAMTAPIGGSMGSEQLAGVSPNDTCHYVELWQSRGLGPYDRAHGAGTYWCFVWASHITYRRTATLWRTGGLCWREAHENHRISGGIGYSWVEIHSEVWFRCHTPWWFDLHDSLWMNIAYNVWGNWQVTDQNT